MATLLTCQSISKHFGTRELFEDLSIGFADDERVGFFGPNGAGKTTFLKILAGLEQADDGKVNKRRSLRTVFLPQEDRFSPDATVWTALADVLEDQHLEQHQIATQVNITLSKFGFTHPDGDVDQLSGGWRKRLAIARAFVQQPDLLLLDEPTNHLDLEGIQWLEDTLLRVPFAFIAVSHDRYFLERVTTRIVELNSVYVDGYFSVSGNYSAFLEKRADFLDSMQAQEVSLTNLVKREAAFLKSKAKARRTKSKVRVEEAYRLQDELRDLSKRNTKMTAGIDFDSTGRKSKMLLEAKGIAKTLGNKLLFKDVSLVLSPGTRLGILGSNGSGKTTLIRVLIGDLPPDEGRIKQADDLKIVLFDQKREALPQDITLREALAGKNNHVEFRGQDIHISAWAKRFLFSLDQLDMVVGDLSGGEQARILIARLMLQPADLLILDEPTNDLDITSLDILEESLSGFSGAIVLVTHDRFMLDRLCTDIVGLNDDGQVGKYTDCAHWQTVQAQRAKGDQKLKGKAKSKKSKKKANQTGLTASEQRELTDMEQTILEADKQLEQCNIAFADPDVAGDQTEVQKRWEKQQAAKKQVETLYARWETLEAKKRS